jgi:glycosyltransferase involved in cell wall biosynthesis
VLERWLAASVVWILYTAALATCRLRPAERRRPWTRSGSLIVVGTFHNPGWYLSHAVPLSRCGASDIIVISDGTLPDVAGVTVYPPPRWLRLLVGRTVSKLVWTFRAGLKFKADLYMGYHIIPNSTIALIVARALGRPACYQMTGGPIELIGGGSSATENPVLGRLRRPVPTLERLAFRMASSFDLVVVRGRSAQRYVEEHAGPPRVSVIPGSVDLAQFRSHTSARTLDMIFVGRLAATKQPLDFVDIVDAVRRAIPGITAAVVGDGPMMDDVKRRIRALGLEHVIAIRGQLTDVQPELASARVFVLTSRSEGLSIAMAEAMIAGAVPVVANVGDLGDLVTDGTSGFLIEPGNISMYADRVVSLLRDQAMLDRFSTAARQTAEGYNGLARVSSLWRENLAALIPGSADVPLVNTACDPYQRP